MRKILSLLLVICALSNESFAQQDSIKRILQQKQLFFADSVSMAEFNFMKRTPLFVSQFTSQLSRITIAHQLEQGRLVAAQGSTKTNGLFLSSEGTAKLKGISLYGSFLYRKSFEDSTRFAHQSRNNPSTPYYFGSPANNHYERTTYHFNALAGKNFLNDKLGIGLGINYLVADHFASNDPRGALKEYQVNSELQVGYQLSKNLQVGVGLNLGYGREDVTIGYKNRLYYESTFYTTYVNYLINGFREPVPTIESSQRKYSDLQDRLGANFVLRSTGKLGSLLAKAAFVQETQNYEYRSSDRILTLSTYTLDKLTADLLWFKQLKKEERISVAIGYEVWDGEDLNTTFAAKNYVYTRTATNIKANYLRSVRKIIYQYGIEGGIFGEEKLDGITSNKFYYNNLALKTSFGIEYQVQPNRSFGTSAGLHYIKNLEDTFLINALAETGPSNFTRTVIFHDYLFQTATKIGGSLQFDYSFPFLKNMQGAIKVGAIYTVKDDMKSFARTVLSTPGNDRLYTNVSFNLYF